VGFAESFVVYFSELGEGSGIFEPDAEGFFGVAMRREDGGGEEGGGSAGMEKERAGVGERRRGGKSF